MEKNDNFIEDYIYNFILKNKNIHEKIISFNDFICSQNISTKDKEDILKFVIWNNIIDSDEEIKETISQYRNGKIISKIYGIILLSIEDQLDIDDNLSLSCIQNEIRMDLEYNIAKISQKIVDFILNSIKDNLKSKKSLFEIISKDYINDAEKQDFFNFIQNISYKFDEEDHKNMKKIKDIINNNIEQKNKILDIK